MPIPLHLKAWQYTDIASDYEFGLKEKKSRGRPHLGGNLQDCCKLGNYEETKQNYRMVLQVREQSLGSWHLKTLQSMKDLVNLGEQCENKGEYEIAASLYLEILDVRE